MTRPMHQDDAATAVFKRTMVLILLVLMLSSSLSSFPSVTAWCLGKCWCYEESVDCFFKGLDRIPDRIPPAIKKLSLNHNEIRDIKSLANLTKLKYLNLDRNYIRDIEPLARLTELQFLSLRYNQIRDIESLAHLTNLTELDLSYNEIMDIESLAHLTNLTDLLLSGNKIDNIETGAFNNLTSLRALFLDYNNIHKIDLDMFKGLTKLNRLCLDNNMIRNIPPGTFDSLTSLSLLQLDHNPLTCDCNILLFVNVLKKNYPQRDVLWNNDPSCHYPVEMNEKPLKEITENDFNCTSPDVVVVPENKTVSVGEQVQLSCKAVGDPEPFITWAKDDIDLELGQRVQVLWKVVKMPCLE